jgi:hypothetical protein
LRARHELILVRSRNNDNAIISSDTALAYQINIFQIEWRVPVVTFNLENQTKMLQILQKETFIDLPFRSWDLHEYHLLPTSEEHTWKIMSSSSLERPRFVIFAFQTGRKNVKAKNMSKFDHCDLVDFNVYLNKESYPHGNLDLRRDKRQLSILYRMYSLFRENYYGKSTTENCMTFDEFFENQIVVVDCQHQNENLLNSPVDIEIRYKCSVAIPAGTAAYCLIIHDKLLEYCPFSGEVRNKIR